jgi:glycosyltransferase involved in cell wall biosynthesis
MTMRKIQLLSIVVPCHNEEEALGRTHQRLVQVCETLRQSKKCVQFEIVYVDNGSTDRTLAVLKGIFEADKHVRIIALRRNFGYQGSLSAGLFHARGDAVVTIDADLQDPPEKIEEMIAYYEDDYDLVLGIREDRKADSLFKRWVSQGYYRCMQAMGVEIVYNHGDFRLMSGALVKEFNELSERNRFIRAMILQLESRYAVVYYRREPRKEGVSKFNLSSLLSLAFSGIVSFTYAPLRMASVLGGILCVFSIVGIFWVLYIKLVHDQVPGWASTLLPMLILGGISVVFSRVNRGVYRQAVYGNQAPSFIYRSQRVRSRKNP